jgi:hypothetical protein
VAALKLNVEFADAGLILGNSGLKFGDLTLCGFTDLTALNGTTVRSFLSTVNTLLGGGTAAYTISQLYPVTSNLNTAFYDGTATTYAQQHLFNGACPVWKNGDLTTYDQSAWGDAGSVAAANLNSNYNTVYASTLGAVEVGIPGTAGYSMRFFSATAVIDYLPAIGAAAALSADQDNPLISNSGQFGGDVLALRLNIDFSDAGDLAGAVNVKFGDLTLCGFADLTALNGTSVRSFLSTVNILLGGGSSTYAISQLDPITIDLNNAFSAGTVSSFAQAHLVNGACP